MTGGRKREPGYRQGCAGVCVGIRDSDRFSVDLRRSIDAPRHAKDLPARPRERPAHLAAAQRLDARPAVRRRPEATPAAVEHLGYVQIDTINVIERCHHHILYTRIPAYQRAHLHQAQSVDKTVFEYWTHALSYVPTGTSGFSSRHEQRPDRRRSWFDTVSRKELRKVARPHPQGRPAHHPRHRRRRAGREGPSLGEPQAVQARAAARFLHRRADRQPARRHAQDLRADRTAISAGTRRPRPASERQIARLPARPGAARAGRS